MPLTDEDKKWLQQLLTGNAPQQPSKRIADMPEPVQTDWTIRDYIRRTAKQSGYPPSKFKDMEGTGARGDARQFMELIGFPVNPNRADWPWVAIVAAHFVNTGVVLSQDAPQPHPILSMSDDEIRAQLPDPEQSPDIGSYMTLAGQQFGITPDQFAMVTTDAAGAEQKLYPHLGGKRLAKPQWPQAFIDYVRIHMGTPDRDSPGWVPGG